MFCKIALRAGLVLGLMWATLAFALAQDDMAGRVLAQINQARANAGLPALARNGQLDAAAQGHANDLLQNGVALGHRGSDGSNIKQRIASAGYGSDRVGENWAAYRTLDQIMNFWLTDPPHRQNILQTNFREIGIGVATRANGGWIIVTDFGGGNAAEMAAPQAQAPNPPKPARPTVVRAKPTAPKPTRAPTRKPTAKPTRAPNIQNNVPTPEPTRIALAVVPKPLNAVALRTRGRVAHALWHANAQAEIGARQPQGDPLRMVLGTGIILSGVILFAVAVNGQRRYRNGHR